MANAVRVVASLMFAIGLTGCTTHRFLDHNSVRQSTTVSDIVQKQVLNNVAKFAVSRDAFPQFAVIGDGTAQVADTGSATNGLAWSAIRFTGATLNMTGSRQLSENWKLSPVMSAGRLKRMRCAFQLIYGHPEFVTVDACTDNKEYAHAYDLYAIEGCTACVKEMVSLGVLPSPRKSRAQEGPVEWVDPTPGEPGRWRFFCKKDDLPAAKARAEEYQQLLTESLNCNFPTGWFCVGTRQEACRCGRRWGRCACISGEHCGTHVWVANGGQDAFSRFTISVLAVATLDPLPGAAKPQELIITHKKAKYELLNKLANAAADLRRIQTFDENANKVLNTYRNKNQRESFQPAETLGSIANRFDRIASETVLTDSSLGILRTDLAKLGSEAKDIREAAKTPEAVPELIPKAVEVAVVRSLDEKSREIVRIKAEVERAVDLYLYADAEMSAQSDSRAGDAFSRPGSMPLSHGNYGIEFVPSLPTP